jgi:bacteriorhodopsin
LWTAYPIVWLIGTEGLSLIPLYWETAAFMVLDVLAKVGFGFLLLRSRSVLERAGVADRDVATTADYTDPRGSHST